MTGNRRIESIDPVRLRAAIADLEGSTEPTERWHEMAEALDDDDQGGTVVGPLAALGLGLIFWGSLLYWVFRS